MLLMSALPTEAKLGIPKMFLNRRMEQEQEAHACKTTQSQRREVCMNARVLQQPSGSVEGVRPDCNVSSGGPSIEIWSSVLTGLEEWGESPSETQGHTP